VDNVAGRRQASTTPRALPHPSAGPAVARL